MASRKVVRRKAGENLSQFRGSGNNVTPVDMPNQYDVPPNPTPVSQNVTVEQLDMETLERLQKGGR